jgi:CubicO group peptidase (beta-lactamase class C family)
MKSLRLLSMATLGLLVSCTYQPDSDIVLIETIENNLLSAVVVEGEAMGGMNILDRMEYYHVPGASIAFLNNGEIVWAKGYGYTSADSTRMVDENTLFQAASISKPVAAMAALALVEEGKIGLDDDVNQYLVDWQVEENKYTEKEKVTLRRILSHSAGLTVHGFAGYASGEELPDILKILDGVDPANSGRIYPDTIPGIQYSYSGGGYTVMQKILIDVTGKKFPELMDEYVLTKIGMRSSTYKQPLPEELEGNAASGHTLRGEIIEGKWHTYPEMAAAGLWTTPSDLLRYAAEVQQSYEGRSNRVLSQEMTQEMLTPQLRNHALGPGTGGSGDSVTFSHGGSNAGFKCVLYAFTKLDQGVVIMTNGDRGGELMTEILRSFAKVYDWSDYKPVIKSVVYLSEDDIQKLAGKYLLNVPEDELLVEFTVEENHLNGIQLWDSFSFKIYPESATRFFNRNDASRLEFLLDENGLVTGMIIHEGSQQYNFKKI